MILVCGMGRDSVELAAAVVLIVLMEVSFGLRTSRSCGVAVVESRP